MYYNHKRNNRFEAHHLTRSNICLIPAPSLSTVYTIGFLSDMAPVSQQETIAGRGSGQLLSMKPSEGVCMSASLIPSWPDNVSTSSSFWDEIILAITQRFAAFWVCRPPHLVHLCLCMMWVCVWEGEESRMTEGSSGTECWLIECNWTVVQSNLWLSGFTKAFLVRTTE